MFQISIFNRGNISAIRDKFQPFNRGLMSALSDLFATLRSGFDVSFRRPIAAVYNILVFSIIALNETLIPILLFGRFGRSGGPRGPGRLERRFATAFYPTRCIMYLLRLSSYFSEVPDVPEDLDILEEPDDPEGLESPGVKLIFSM